MALGAYKIVLLPSIESLQRVASWLLSIVERLFGLICIKVLNFIDSSAFSTALYSIFGNYILLIVGV